MTDLLSLCLILACIAVARGLMYVCDRILSKDE
jgi:hypothetical protein